MKKKYIMALDQGVTSSRAILFNHEGEMVKVAQKEFTQFYPKAGWVEHDPMEIWGTQSGVAREVLETAGIRPQEIAAIGITNQRETTALGAAFLAGLAVGFWKDRNEISSIWMVEKVFNPKMDYEHVRKIYKGWEKAVGRSLNWAEEE